MHVDVHAMAGGGGTVIGKDILNARYLQRKTRLRTAKPTAHAWLSAPRPRPHAWTRTWLLVGECILASGSEHTMT